MAKEPKKHNSRIEIDTACPDTQALELALQTLGTQRGITLEQQGTGFLTAVVKNPLGFRLLDFSVEAAADTQGRTNVSTKLLSYRTSQWRIFEFIPIGPKTIEGYAHYLKCMQALQQVFASADPSARSLIIEQDGQPA